MRDWQELSFLALRFALARPPAGLESFRMSVGIHLADITFRVLRQLERSHSSDGGGVTSLCCGR